MVWRATGLDEKRVAREIALDCGPCRSVLLMPGYCCEDAKLALEKGVVDEHSTVVFVERDPQVYEEIVRWVEREWSLLLPPLVYKTDLCDLKMVPTDFAFIDLFGNLTRRDWTWIEHQLVPNLMPGANLCFTFCQTVRNQFMQKVITVMEPKDIYKERLAALPKNIKGLARSLAATYQTLFEEGFLKGYQYAIDFHPYKNSTSKHAMLLMRLKNIVRS
jgi:hypothetical protein